MTRPADGETAPSTPPSAAPPAGWATVALGDVLQPVERVVTVEDGVEYRQVKVRVRAGGLVLRGTAPGERIGTKRQLRIRAGQLVVSRIDARNGGFGLVPDDLDGAVVTRDFPTFDVDAGRCRPGYLRLLLARPAFWEACAAVSHGTTNRVRLDVEEFLQLGVDLPPLDEQRRVVEAVGVVDAHADACGDEAAAVLAALRAAVDARIAPGGDLRTLPVGWTLRRLDEVSDVAGGMSKNAKRASAGTVAVPFLRAANVQDGHLDLRDVHTILATDADATRYALAPGDVLLTEGGNAEHLGRGWLWDGQVDGCVHQNHVFRARPRRETVEPRFLAYAITASPARAYCLERAKKTTNLASISKTQISGLPVPVPSLEEQRRVVDELDTLRGHGAAAYAEHAAALRARDALVERLVSSRRASRDADRPPPPPKPPAAIAVAARGACPPQEP